MFTITTRLKPASTKFMISETAFFAGFDEEVAIVDFDDIEESGGRPIDPELRGIMAGARADALYEFLKETSHF